MKRGATAPPSIAVPRHTHCTTAGYFEGCDIVVSELGTLIDYRAIDTDRKRK